MNSRKPIVLKFGSSVLRNEDDLASAVHEIYRWWRDGAQVIAVVSAFGDTTDQLMRQAEKVCDNPDKAVLPSLLATGEATSSALLTLALRKVGIAARLFDEVQAKLRTVGGGIDAVPVAVDASRLLNESRRAVVVLPGFVGRDEGGDRTLLGRGGSDLTALFLAHQLKGHCVLLKDVDGLYTSDPACRTVRASRFAEVSYATALRVGGGVVQPKAVRFAAANKLRFSITGIGAQGETEVGPFPDRLDDSGSPSEPLRVALLGCGTVGGGVFQRLAGLPELFQVTGVGTRTGIRARAAGVLPELITSDLESLVDKPCDVVIELIGGTQRAASLIEQSLKLGRAVVSANKALLAESHGAFETLAAENGASLHYSAAVGGVLPALETIKRTRANGPLKGFSGVVNGTCNFVLDQLAGGTTFGAAVKLAQERGYAEEHPELDLEGIDAAQKLILLARAAFDTSLPIHSIARKGINGLNPEAMRQAQERGRTMRLVADCKKTDGRITASVAPVELPFKNPLAQVTGAENRLIVQPELGEPIVVSGSGAGRWPTTEAVIADLFEIRRRQSVDDSEESEELEACA
jgi:homoserine dehydrogenase